MAKRFIIFSVVILALLLVGSFLFTEGFGMLSIYGTSTLSLDRVNLQSSVSQLNGQVWMLTFRAGGLSQRYFGSFSPSEVEAATSGDLKPIKDFSIEVEYEDQTCNYDITSTSYSTPIYNDVKMETWGCILYPDSYDAQEHFGSGTVLFYGKDTVFSGFDQCWAVGSPTKSPVGRLESPDINSEFTISIDAGSDSASRTFNTLSGTTQGTIGDFAYAIWQGNLVSGKSCKDKDPYIPIYVNGVWRIGAKSSYDVYVNSLRNLNTVNRNEREIVIRDIRSLVTQAKSSQSFGSFNSVTSLNSASVESIVQDPVQFPVTTLYIEADSIGIFTPAPEAKLFSPNSECFRTGDQGSIEIGIENVGDDFGTWNIFAECDSGFRTTRNIQVSLAPGQSDIRLIPLTATTTEERTGRCTIIAESPAGQVKTSVGVCVKPQITCNAGESWCSTSGDREVVKKCSSTGATSSVSKTCAVDQYCEDLQCIDRKGPVPDPDLNNWFKRTWNNITQFFGDLVNGIFGVFFAIKVLIIAIGTLIGTLLLKSALSGMDAIKNNQAAQWIISIIFGILFGVVLSIFVGSFIFWILLIAGILSLIFFNQIKGIFGR